MTSLSNGSLLRFSDHLNMVVLPSLSVTERSLSSNYACTYSRSLRSQLLSWRKLGVSALVRSR